MNMYLDILYDCPLFIGKEMNSIENLLSQTNHKIRHFEKNNFIFRTGQPSNYIGIILDGFIEVQDNLKSGDLLIILYKKIGDVLATESVFSNNATYQFDIIAKNECDILLIHKQSMLNFLLKDPIIYTNILNILSSNSLVLNRIIELYSYSSIQKKIAYSLLYNVNPCNNHIIQLPFSKKTWADHLNISRTSLYRELNKLCASGIITIHDNIITILEKEKLEFILDDE